jgi:AraC-like DNA-binding protein
VDVIRAGSADEWEDLVTSNFYALGVDRIDQRFVARARVSGMPRGIRIAEMDVGSSTLHRTRRMVRAEPSDDLLFLMQLSGSSQLEQAGMRIELRAGYGVYCDPTVPYSISSPGGRHIVTMVPRVEVLPPRSSAADLRMRPLDLALAPLRVFRLLAEEMASDSGTATEMERVGVATAATDLLRSAALMASVSRMEMRPWSDEALLATVRNHLLTRIGDPSLRMADVARAHDISVRRLTGLFGPGDSPAAFLRRERLRRAREELIDPRFSRVPTADIGARWGYPEPSTFGRAFRREFGMSPRDARGS